MPSPTDPITYDSLPNNGWGEPPCAHTAPVAYCAICDYWRYQSASTRAGLAATTKVDYPSLYITPTPEARAAGLVRLQQVRSRNIPGGMRPLFGTPPRRTPPTPRSTWTVTATTGAFGESRAERSPPPPAPATRAAPTAPPTKSGKPPGPGGHLYAMYTSWGLPHCSACAKLAAKMDAWGPAGCRERLEEIIADIKSRKNMRKLIRDVTKAVLTGKVKRDALKMPLTIRGQVLEAIRRAEAQP
jgi:hypothetical protein